MIPWIRVFCRSDVPIATTAILQWLHEQEPEADASFRGDDLGWFQADVRLDDETLLRIDRYLTKEDEIRGELNTWAAWLENAGDSPAQLRLMQHIINTAQLVTLHQPADRAGEISDDPLDETLCISLCQFLADACDGVYQCDHRGFFAADGTLLVAE